MSVSSLSQAPGLPGTAALFGLLASVPAERPGHRELAELVADHVLGDVHRNELVAVVHGDRVTDHLRDDRRAARPGADDPLVAPFVHRIDLPREVIVDEVALLQ